MTNEEKILFEEYFQITGYKGQKIDDKYLFLIINILLNSESLEDSELLTLTVKQTDFDLNNFSFYATYYNKEKLDNFDMTGTIKIKDNKIYLLANIHDFKEEKDIEIGELFEKIENTISRFTTYQKNDYTRKSITIEEFEKAKYFIEDKITKLKGKSK